MSYTKRYRKTIRVPYSGTVHYSGSVSYPSSQTGGSKSYSGSEHYSGYVDEEVEIEIDVDTSPFDRSISGCNSSINTLTGAVAATETAQVVAIKKNSDNVANTIIEGFFSMIRSDLSSKAMELKNRLEAKAIQLKKQSAMLLDKRSQMKEHYDRVTERYEKIFEDLNTELENRIKAVDMPIYKAEAEMSAETNRMLSLDSLGVATISNSENMRLESQIGSALLKKRAEASIGQACDFLAAQRDTDEAIKKTVISGNIDNNSTYYLPVLFVENSGDKGVVCQSCFYDKNSLPDVVDEQVKEQFQTREADDFTEEKREKVESFFNILMQQQYGSLGTEHAERVKNLINQLFYTK